MLAVGDSFLEETLVEIRGLPPSVKVRLDKPSTPLELRRNEVTQHAIRLQWKFRVRNLPSPEKPWVALEVLDGHGKVNTVEVWDPHQSKMTCGCEDYTRDESGWCLHTAAWKTWWRMGSLWSQTSLRMDGSPKATCLVSPTSQEVTRWHLRMILQLQRVPLKKETWQVPVKVWDSWLRKCQIFGTGQVLGRVKDNPDLWKVSESTVTARRLLLLPEEVLEERQNLPDADDLLVPGLVSLYDYQKEALEKMVYRKRLVCSMSVGSGKTLTTIATIAVLREINKTSPRVLVVCPKSLGLQWGGEIGRVLSDTSVVYTNSPTWERQWAETEKSGYTRFLVTTYQYLQRNLDSFTGEHWDVVVADEIQYVKNGDSKTWKALSQIQSEYFYGLSGTVIENRLDDLFSVMEIVSPGRLGSLWRFLSDYQEVKEVTPTKVLYGDLTNLQDLHQKLDPWVFTLPSSFAASRLPPLLQTQVTVTLSPDLRAHHDYHHGEAKKLLAKSLRGQISHYEKMMIQAHLLKARQACNSPELITKVRPPVRPPKVETFLEVFDSHKTSGEKLVVFSQWTEMLDILQREIKDPQEYARFDGSMTANARKKSVEKFLQDPKCVVFLSSDAGGVGLDGLQTVATTVLHTELPWNPARLDQRNGRLHRIGQKGLQVSAITMVAEDTIESKMVELLVAKREIRELALAGL